MTASNLLSLLFACFFFFFVFILSLGIVIAIAMIIMALFFFIIIVSTIFTFTCIFLRRTEEPPCQHTGVQPATGPGRHLELGVRHSSVGMLVVQRYLVALFWVQASYQSYPGTKGC